MGRSSKYDYCSTVYISPTFPPGIWRSSSHRIWWRWILKIWRRWRNTVRIPACFAKIYHPNSHVSTCNLRIRPWWEDDRWFNQIWPAFRIAVVKAWLFMGYVYHVTIMNGINSNGSKKWSVYYSNPILIDDSPGLMIPNPNEYVGLLSHKGYPSSHPFLLWDFPIKINQADQPAIGVPPWQGKSPWLKPSDSFASRASRTSMELNDLRRLTSLSSQKSPGRVWFKRLYVLYIYTYIINIYIYICKNTSIT